MFKTGIAAAALAAAVGMSGCATRAETIGAGAGMAAGAALGGGTIGTVGGAMVGYAAGRHYDQKHND